MTPSPKDRQFYSKTGLLVTLSPEKGEITVSRGMERYQASGNRKALYEKFIEPKRYQAWQNRGGWESAGILNNPHQVSAERLERLERLIKGRFVGLYIARVTTNALDLNPHSTNWRELGAVGFASHTDRKQSVTEAQQRAEQSLERLNHGRPPQKRLSLKEPEVRLQTLEHLDTMGLSLPEKVPHPAKHTGPTDDDLGAALLAGTVSVSEPHVESPAPHVPVEPQRAGNGAAEMMLM